MPFVQLASSDMNFHYVVGSSADMQTVDPQKETLLMLHPGLCDLHYFDAQFHDPRLTSKYNLVAFDARGHGLSHATPLPNVTLERKARCLLEAWDKLGLGDCHVYGESLCGTSVAVYLAVLRPDMVRSLILVSPMHGYERQPNLGIYEDVMKTMLEKKQRGQTGGFSPSAVVSLQHLLQGEHTTTDDKVAWAKHLQWRYGESHTADEVYELFNPLINRKPIPDALLEDIEAPVLMLHGTEDCAATLERCQLLQDGFSAVPGGAQLHLIHGAPHYLTQTVPTIVTRFILRFLEQHPGKI